MVARLRLIVVVLVLAAGGCKRKPPPEPPPPPAPVDHLAPNEIVEGTDKAFGLPLPRFSTVTGRFDTSVVVRSPLSPQDLVRFVQGRVREGNVTDAGAATRFENVMVPAEPKRRLTIDIRPAAYSGTVRSEMMVRDTTPPAVEPGLTDEQRWKKQGLGPDGKLLDPTHTQ